MSQTYAEDDEIEIDLQEIFGLLIHKIWLILLCGIVAGGIGFGISKFLLTPMYQSTTRVYILNSSDKNNGGNITYSDTQLASTLTKDYEELITSRFVLETVIDKLQLTLTYDTLKKRIEVSNANNTRIIDISVKATSPQAAKIIADAVRDVSAEQIKSVMNIEAVNLVDEANLPTKKCEPSIRKYTAIGFLGGAVLMAIIIVVIYLLDDTIKTSDDVEKYLDLSTLAMIPDASVDEKEAKKKHNHKSKPTEPKGQSKVVVEDLEDDDTEEGGSENAGD